jgi:hypothetical protein
MIPLLSGLGLGLAMASDTPTASHDKPYPAKIIVGWESDHAVIERPFTSQLREYSDLTGVPYEKIILSSPVIYRAPGQYLIIIPNTNNGFTFRPNIHFCAESTPRILWFLDYLVGKLIRKRAQASWGPDAAYLSYFEKLCLGLPFSIAPKEVEKKRLWNPLHLSAFFEEVVEILSQEPCYLPHGSFTVCWQSPGGESTLTLPDRIKLLELGKLYLKINFNIFYGDTMTGDQCSFLDSQQGWYKNPFSACRFKVENNKSVIDHFLQAGIIELDDDYDARIKRMIEEGTPDYMDGYESMATLIDKKQGISWLSEDEFEEMFRTSP